MYVPMWVRVHVRAFVRAYMYACMHEHMNQFKAFDMLWTPETTPTGWVVLKRIIRTREWGDLQRA